MIFGIIILVAVFISMIIKINQLGNIIDIKEDQITILIELLKLNCKDLEATKELNTKQKKAYIEEMIMEQNQTLKLLTKEVDEYGN